MQVSKDNISQKGSINQNGSKSMSQEKSLIINYLDSVASSKNISKDSKAYKSLSMIMQVVDISIRTDRNISQNSHILDSLSIDNKQQLSVDINLQNSKNSFNQLSKSQEVRLRQEHCKQVIDIFVKQHEEQTKLERENNFMNLLIRFLKNSSPDLYTVEELVKLLVYFKQKHKQYKIKCKKIINQSKQPNAINLNESDVSP